MNHIKKLSAVFVFVMCVFAIPFEASAQLLEVSPASHDFGNVVVDESSLMEFTITNIDGRPVRVDSVTIVDDASESFTIVSAAPPPAVILYSQESLSVFVEFGPNGTGMHTASMFIQSDDTPPFNENHVPLQGLGVLDEGDPTELMAGLVDFFDASVADGSVVGNGPGDSASRRLRAFGNMLDAADDLIAEGDFEAACDQLNDAYHRADGEDRPPEFIAGDNKAEVAGMILDVMAALGCP